MADEFIDASSAIGMFAVVSGRLCGGFKMSDEAIEKRWSAHPSKPLRPMLQINRGAAQ